MSMRSWPRLPVLMLLLSASAAATTSFASATVSITPKDCVYGPTGDPEFARFGDDALTCRHPKRGTPVLVIVSVDVERFCARRAGVCDIEVPLPRILDAQGREVGRLPANFPGEAAVSYRVQLEAFRGNWPRTLRLIGESQGVGSAPVWTPLRWQPRSGRYSEGRLKP